MKKQHSNYDVFAWFYNRYWSIEIPEQMMTAVSKLLLPQLSTGSRILDLCCGTGHLAAALTERGYRVTGIDGSAEMLRYAVGNAPAAQFVQADARVFQVASVYRGVVSTFDSLNHFTSLDELTNVFRCVHNALIEGGRFLFDLNMEKGFQIHWRDHFSIVEDDSVCMMRGGYLPEEKLGRYDITLFRFEESKWQRADLQITERCYSKNEIRQALNEVGFQTISVYDAEREVGLTGHVGRSFFLACK